MMGRAAALAFVAGLGVALIFGGLWTTSSPAFTSAFVMGILAGAFSFTVAMAIFFVAMPRMDQRIAVFLALALGGVAAFVLGYLL